MQDYIKHLTYIDKDISSKDFATIAVEKYSRVKIDKEHPSYADSAINFTQEKFKYPYLPLYIGQYEIPDSEEISENVLRLMIRDNNEDSPIILPKSLLKMKDLILDSINYHRQHYCANKDAYIYVTVRSCTYAEMYYKNSSSWHIDGFQGARMEKHIVEQNMFWCNKSPTDFLLQPFFCDGLDPSKHDINHFFDTNANENFLVETQANSIYFVNPYQVHRVNPKSFEGKRVFIRLNFSPVLIEDYTNTQNPLLSSTIEKRRDVRDFLRNYPIDESIDSGFSF